MAVRSENLGRVPVMSPAGTIIAAPLLGERLLLKDWTIYNASAAGAIALIYISIVGVDFILWRGQVPGQEVKRPERQEFVLVDFPGQVWVAGTINMQATLHGARLIL